VIENNSDTELVTPPLDEFLSSVTRQSILDLE
jgi:branched-subunit amino acid aminotransferase/4-amino-4-deoxychorismate lyase